MSSISAATTSPWPSTISRLPLLLRALAIALSAAFAVKAAAFVVRLHLRSRASPIKGVPCPPRQHFLLGHIPLFLASAARRYDMILEQHRALGVNWALNIPNGFGIRAVLFTSDPAVVQHVLKDNFDNYVKGERFQWMMAPLLGNGIFSANGESWYRSRKVASQIFSTRNFRESLGKSAMEGLKTLIRHLERAADTGTVIDLEKSLQAFTTDSFGLFAFSEDFGCLVDPDHPPPFAAAFDGLSRLLVRRGESLFGRLAPHLPTRQNAEIERMVRVLDAFAYGKIRARRTARGSQARGQDGAEAKETVDLLDFFMDYEDADGEKLSDKDLRDMMLNMLTAGRDTTSLALSWAFFTLSDRPDVVAKIREEVQRVTGGAIPTYEQTKDLKYVTAVFYEILRLHPSVPLEGKHSVGSDVLPPSGISIAPRTIVAWSVYAMNRLEQNWGPDAESFNPDRWLQRDGGGGGGVTLKRESAFKWPVFNGGPRLCLGQAMATFQGVAVLSAVLTRFNFDVVARDEVAYAVGVTLNMKNGLRVRVRARDGELTDFLR
ncbi:cytochrome P450 [Zopfochytrium polystomum]|nr:cytochrome P450 [Zopfochytrium polystomum]